MTQSTNERLETELQTSIENGEALEKALNKKIIKANNLSRELEDLRLKYAKVIQDTTAKIADQKDTIDKQSTHIEFITKKFEETDERLKTEVELRDEEESEFTEEKQGLEEKIKVLNDEITSMRKMNQMMTLQ